MIINFKKSNITNEKVGECCELLTSNVLLVGGGMEVTFFFKCYSVNNAYQYFTMTHENYLKVSGSS